MQAIGNFSVTLHNEGKSYYPDSHVLVMGHAPSSNTVGVALLTGTTRYEVSPGEGIVFQIPPQADLLIESADQVTGTIFNFFQIATPGGTIPVLPLLDFDGRVPGD